MASEGVMEDVTDAIEEEVELTDSQMSEDEQEESRIPEEYVEIARKVSAGEELSDEELDQVADAGIEILRTMLSYFDADGATIDEYDGDNGQLIFNVTGEDLGILIG